MLPRILRLARASCVKYSLIVVNSYVIQSVNFHAVYFATRFQVNSGNQSGGQKHCKDLTAELGLEKDHGVVELCRAVHGRTGGPFVRY